jgi:hypothetical protein
MNFKDTLQLAQVIDHMPSNCQAPVFKSQTVKRKKAEHYTK